MYFKDHRHFQDIKLKTYFKDLPFKTECPKGLYSFRVTKDSVFLHSHLGAQRAINCVVNCSSRFFSLWLIILKGENLYFLSQFCVYSILFSRQVLVLTEQLDKHIATVLSVTNIPSANWSIDSMQSLTKSPALC